MRDIGSTRDRRKFVTNIDIARITLGDYDRQIYSYEQQLKELERDIKACIVTRGVIEKAIQFAEEHNMQDVEW